MKKFYFIISMFFIAFLSCQDNEKITSCDNIKVSNKGCDETNLCINESSRYMKYNVLVEPDTKKEYTWFKNSDFLYVNYNVFSGDDEYSDNYYKFDISKTCLTPIKDIELTSYYKKNASGGATEYDTIISKKFTKHFFLQEWSINERLVCKIVDSFPTGKFDEQLFWLEFREDNKMSKNPEQ